MIEVCREGGAGVRANVMDLAEHNRLDGRRLEVVADGFPVAQIASTPRWCLHSTGMGEPGEVQPSTTEKLWKRLDVARNGRAVNLLAKEAGTAGCARGRGGLKRGRSSCRHSHRSRRRKTQEKEKTKRKTKGREGPKGLLPRRPKKKIFHM